MIINLKTELENLNNKIIILNRLCNKLPYGHRIFKNKLNKLIQKRDQCFRELRESLRKSNPELFIGSDY